VFWLAVKPAPPGEKDNPETVRDDLMGFSETSIPWCGR
jgi:hypothetical protein